MTASKGAPPSFIGLLKAYPWLGVLLALSLIVTLWAATRRPAPAPEPIPPAAAPAVAAPAPDPEPEPTVWPDHTPPAEDAPAGPDAAPVHAVQDAPPPPSTVVTPNADGTWQSGPPAGGR